MKKYYIYQNKQQEGPFDFQQLTQKKISPKTKVWHTGLDKWKNAEEVEELQALIVIETPPTFTEAPKPKPELTIEPEPTKTTPQFTKQEETNTDSNQYINKRKAYWMIGIFTLIFTVILTFIITYYQKKEFQRINDLTNLYNKQVQLKNELIKKQSQILNQQEEADRQRREREKNIAIEKRREELKLLITTAKENLKKAKSKQSSANEFQLLRSSEEKTNEINTAKNEVQYWEEQITALEDEIRNLGGSSYNLNNIY